MGKRKRRISAEESAFLEERYARTARLLEERIAYHTAKSVEEKRLRRERAR